MSQANNSFQLVGRLTRDAEVKTTQNNDKYMQFSLAVDRPPKRDANGKVVVDDNGRAVCDTDFPYLVLWGDRVEGLAKAMTKGSMVAVNGNIRTRNTEVDGQKRTYTDLRVDDVRLLQTKKKDAESGSEEAPSGGSPAAGQAEEEF